MKMSDEMRRRHARTVGKFRNNTGKPLFRETLFLELT